MFSRHSSVILSTVFLLFSLGNAAFAAPQRIAILTSRIGDGHIQVANSVAAAIQREADRTHTPVEIDILVIEDYLQGWAKPFYERFNLLLLNHCRALNVWAYQTVMRSGNRAQSLRSPCFPYDDDRLFQTLKQKGYQTVLADHFYAAQMLGYLRERGRLLDTALGYILTDYYDTRVYFHRIAREADKTFVTYPELQINWLSRGVPADRIALTGIAVSPEDFPDFDEPEFLRSQGLDPLNPTIVLGGGGEGLLDYEAIIRDIANHFPESMQIVALTGKNSAARSSLEKGIRKGLFPARMKIFPLGKIDRPEVLKFLKIADVFITKPGAISMTEAALARAPTLLVRSFGAWEDDNIRNFTQRGLALTADGPDSVHVPLHTLLYDDAALGRISVAQTQLAQSQTMAPIVDFALHGKPNLCRLSGLPTR